MKYLLTITPLFLIFSSCGEKPSPPAVNSQEKPEIQIQQKASEPKTAELASQKSSPNLKEQNITLQYQPARPKLNKTLSSLETYRKEANKLKQEWRKEENLHLKELNDTLESYNDFYTNRRQEKSKISAKYNSTFREAKKKELYDVRKIQTNVMMELTNKVFDEEALGNKDSDLSNKLLALNKKLHEIEIKLNEFDSYFKKIKDAKLVPYESKNFRGYSSQTDKLCNKIESNQKSYFDKLKQLSLKHSKELTHMPLEISLIYQSTTPHKGKNIIGVYNHSDKELSVENINLDLSNDKLVESYEIVKKTALMGSKRGKILSFPPQKMTLLALHRQTSGNSLALRIGQTSSSYNSLSSIVGGMSPFTLILELHQLYDIPFSYTEQYAYKSGSTVFSNFSNQSIVANDEANIKGKIEELSLLNQLVINAGSKLAKKKDNDLSNDAKKRYTTAKEQFRNFQEKIIAEQNEKIKALRSSYKENNDLSNRSTPSVNGRSRNYRSIPYTNERNRSSQQQSIIFSTYDRKIKDKALELGYPNFYTEFKKSTNFEMTEFVGTELNKISSELTEIILNRSKIDLKWGLAPSRCLHLDCILKKGHHLYFKVRNMSTKSLQSASFRIEPIAFNSESVNYLKYLANMNKYGPHWKPGESRYFYMNTSSTHNYLNELDLTAVLSSFPDGLEFESSEGIYLIKGAQIETGY